MIIRWKSTGIIDEMPRDKAVEMIAQGLVEEVKDGSASLSNRMIEMREEHKRNGN